MPLRCCDALTEDEHLRESYASVVYGDVGTDLAALERGKIVSCFTGLCPRCKRVSLITTGVDSFPTASAHHAHILTLIQKERRFFDLNESTAGTAPKQQAEAP